VTRGPRVIDSRVKAEMKRILAAVQSGEFAREWLLETRAGKPVFNALTRQGEEHRLEEVGRSLRALMPWLGERKLVDKSRN
jgi:ketol-acid reductoisomerase